MQITEAMIDRAAKAAWERSYRTSGILALAGVEWERLEEWARERWRSIARAALEAALGPAKGEG